MADKIKNVITNTLFIIAMIILVTSGINYVRTGSYTVFGYKILRIASASMEPTLMTGNYVIAKQVKPDDEVEVGGIYTYVSENGLYTVTHRLKEEIIINGEKTYRFKGDNNSSNDNEFVSRKRIKYEIIPVFCCNDGDM